MNTKRLLATQQDVDELDPSRTKFNCGGGIHMRIHTKGYRYFQFRVSVNGLDTTKQLGKHPAMTLAQAREKAEKYREEVVNARQRKADTVFRAKLRQPTDEKKDPKGRSFKDMSEVGQFIRSLFEASISKETGSLFWLQMLIPSRPNELINAKWEDFMLERTEWAVKRPGIKRTVNSATVNVRSAFLSQSASAALGHLHQLTGTGEYLFPTLADMKKPIREEKIIAAMRTVWPNASVDLNDFRYFFKAMANQHSYFRAELIDAMITHQDRHDVRRNRTSSILQREALANWWANELEIASALPHYRMGIV